jgi:hypothetical protein
MSGANTLPWTGELVLDKYPPEGHVVIRSIDRDGKVVECRLILREEYGPAVDEDMWARLDARHRRMDADSRVTKT